MKKIYTDIVGDLFHIGHVEFLKKCKSLGDYLIVGICDDASCEANKRLPILSSPERVAMVKELKCVDEVIVDAPYQITRDLIVTNKIDLVVHAHDKEEQWYWDECYNEAIAMGIFKRIDRHEGISTTDIINRIIKRHFEKTLEIKVDKQ